MAWPIPLEAPVTRACGTVGSGEDMGCSVDGVQVNKAQAISARTIAGELGSFISKFAMDASWRE
jgi:hypothetical protein